MKTPTAKSKDVATAEKAKRAVGLQLRLLQQLNPTSKAALSVQYWSDEHSKKFSRKIYTRYLTATCVFY